MKKLILTCLAVVVSGSLLGGMIFLGTPVADIEIVAYSPQELHDKGAHTTPSTGLSVVGRGELVYFYGSDAGGADVTAFLWSITSAPTGSAATLDSTDTAMTTFRPDSTGQYEISLQVTTDGGVDETSITLTVALYVGAAGGPPSCQFCHATNYGSWEETDHSNFFTKAIDGEISSHYNEGCIKCHTVGYDTTAANDGFADVQKRVGWEFPETLEAGNWDSLVANFPELAQKANIQCESCHGPGSEHIADKTKIEVSLDEGVCGKCHEEAPYHRRNTMWKESRHAVGVGFAAGRDGCADCHSGKGFIARFDDDFKARGDVLGFPQVSCAVCHDPHSPNNPKQLRYVEDVTLNNDEVVTFGGRGRFCMSCHISRRNAETYVTEFHRHFGPHHSNQTDMLAGTNAIFFGFNIPSTNHKGVIPDLCVTCHMSPTPGPGEPGRDLIGDHTFAMHTDNGTPEDPTDDVDNVSACVNCHGPVTSFDDFIAKRDYDRDGEIESVQYEIKGLLDMVGELLPPIGDPAVEVTEAYTPLQLRAAYNHAFVHDDGSYGAHNFSFALNLLLVAHGALTTGDLGAGAILDISDIPYDQGKQVRVVWERFSGDGIGNMPIEEYGLWRRVDAYAHDNGLGKAIKTVDFESVADNLDELEVGTRVLVKLNERGMNTELWDFVGTVPAAEQDYYSTVVPTLYDSTITHGNHWSVFVVSGHTDVPAVYVVSEPDSGYSIDNLAPAAPANVSFKESAGTIVLDWDESLDADFKFFSVYRSTEAGVYGTEPIAKTTDPTFTDSDVTLGVNYYYRTSSTDFAGNESLLSDEIAAVVTSVHSVDLGTIPDEFTLYQNYPNPFNPSTEITFGLPSAENVRVVVYNILGAQVKVLTDDVFAPGNYRLLWNGDDEYGNQVGPGMYIYRLESNSTTLTKKMMYIK